MVSANVLASFAGNRRAALWHALVAVPDRDLLCAAGAGDATPAFVPLTQGQTIAHDYHALGWTLGHHPLALLRAVASASLAVGDDAAGLSRRAAGARGLVTVRQRPSSANGVLFMTLEDETSHTNVIIWPSLLERQRKEALGASLLAVYGVWQRHGQVIHLVAQRLVDLSHLLGSLTTTSRNFFRYGTLGQYTWPRGGTAVNQC
ncbi:hypothetical protein IHE30_12970 [Mycetohabitans sp. B46]